MHKLLKMRRLSALFREKAAVHPLFPKSTRDPITTMLSRLRELPTPTRKEPRSRSARRDYDDEYEPQPRERRREPSAPEPREPQEKRERRESRDRAQRSPREAEERTGERRPAPILPSWEEASSYVVNFNLSRRNRRGRNK